MKITQVHYSALANLGNYENEKVELSAQLEEGENYHDCLEDLKLKVHAELNNVERYQKLQRSLRDKARELQTVHELLEKAKAQWEIVSTFMVSQGIKTDMAAFPVLPQLAPAPQEVLEPDMF